MQGVNLWAPPTQAPGLVEWWGNGPTLVGALDQMDPPKRLTDKPFRMPVVEVTSYLGIGSCSISYYPTFSNTILLKFQIRNRYVFYSMEYVLI